MFCLIMRTQVQFGKSCLWTEVPVQPEANAASSNSGTQQSVSITYFFVTIIEMISARLTHFPHQIQLHPHPNSSHFYIPDISTRYWYILITDYHWPSWINTIIRIFYALFCHFLLSIIIWYIIKYYKNILSLLIFIIWL